MINVGIVSDLHVEFWKPLHYKQIGKKIQNQLAKADVVLMAGDIANSDVSISVAHSLFPDKPVFMVAGNHEFYGNDYNEVLLAMRKAAAVTPNVTFLHKDVGVITLDARQIRIIGATLWTDFELHVNPDLALLDAMALRDFDHIDLDGRSLRPRDTMDWHRDERHWIEQNLDDETEYDITILLTHHAPVSFAIAPQYVCDHLSPCFASRMEAVLLRDDLNLVVWGHTHHCVDKVIENTHFVSNQTGYPWSAVNHAHTETGQYGTVVAIP